MTGARDEFNTDEEVTKPGVAVVDFNQVMAATLYNVRLAIASLDTKILTLIEDLKAGRSIVTEPQRESIAASLVAFAENFVASAETIHPEGRERAGTPAP